MAKQLSQYPEDARRIVCHLQLQQQELTLLILKTPTGSVRNYLTEANIYLLAALASILNMV